MSGELFYFILTLALFDTQMQQNCSSYKQAQSCIFDSTNALCSIMQ